VYCTTAYKCTTAAQQQQVVEKLNLLVGSNGAVLHSEIVGAVKMKSFLSGMPELKLGLNDKLLFESTGRTSGKVCVKLCLYVCVTRL
jgi:Adaptor complexes medium subunit family